MLGFQAFTLLMRQELLTVHAVVCWGGDEGPCLCWRWGATGLKVSGGALKSLWPSQE